MNKPDLTLNNTITNIAEPCRFLYYEVDDQDVEKLHRSCPQNTLVLRRNPSPHPNMEDRHVVRLSYLLAETFVTGLHLVLVTGPELF